LARILIAGGSLGGLFAANMLWRDGHDVLVLEKVRGNMNGRGAGIVTHDALVEALARAGIGPQDATLGVEVPGRVLLDTDGRTHSRLDMPQVLTSWSRLYELLRRAFPAERYLQGISALRAEDLGTGVVLHAEHEGQARHWEGDLLVACDGIRSTLRQQLFAQVQPRYAGYVAWRGVCDESVLSQYTLDTLFPYFGFSVPPSEQMIGYPVAGPRNETSPGQRAYNYVWYRPAPEGEPLRALLSDADGHHHPLGIAPNKVSWRQVARMREEAQQLLAPQFAEIVQKTAMPFLQPIFDLVSEQLCAGRVVLLGDAAFVGRPHIGMGVTKAAQDAQALADALRQLGPTPQALRLYESARLPAGRSAVARARWLGAYLEGRAPADFTEAERLRMAIAETAIDLGRYGAQSLFKETTE